MALLCIALSCSQLGKHGSEIDGSLGTLKGTRLATTGQILGAVHIVGGIVIICCLLAYVLFGQYLFPSGPAVY